jgi:hypothetical protein
MQRGRDRGTETSDISPDLSRRKNTQKMTWNMGDWLRVLDDSAQGHYCDLDYKDCEELREDIKKLITEKDREIAELKVANKRLKECVDAHIEFENVLMHILSLTEKTR